MKFNNLEDIYLLSSIQEGILFHNLYAPESGSYFNQLTCTLQGDLHMANFKQAWQDAVDRHPVLRTSFYWEDVEKPLQVVHKRVELPVEVEDWRGMSEAEQAEKFEVFLKADRARGFELSQAPLMRLSLIRVTDDSYRFVWSFHHLLHDGWSTYMIIKEVLTDYEAHLNGQKAQLERRRPYRDYILWLQKRDLSQAESYWRQSLKGFTQTTPLGLDRAHEDRPGEERYVREIVLMPEPLKQELQLIARQNQLTLNTLVQGAWALMLSRYSGADDVVFGAIVSGRPAELAGVESMIGLFINSLPVRARVDERDSFLNWLKKHQTEQVEARLYDCTPLVQIHGWSEVPRGLPLFDSLFVFENYPVDDSIREGGGSLKLSNSRSIEWVNYPLTLISSSDLALMAIYDSHRFDSETISRMFSHYTTLMASVAANPEQPMSEIKMLSEQEEQRLTVAWNQTDAEYDRDAKVHELIERQALANPEATAVICEGQSMTFADLNCKANQLAHRLIKCGVQPDTPVAVCMERSFEMVVALLGVLKAGGAYLPLDPTHPPERMAFMLSESSAPVLLTQERFAYLPAQQARVICLDVDALADEPTVNPAVALEGSNLAYIIYTSGSTGQPKGVMNTHEAIANRLLWMQAEYGLSAADCVLQKTPFGFDVSVWEFFWPLMVGARLVMARPEGHKDASYLIELIKQEQVTTLHFVPSMLQVFLAAYGVESCESLKRVFSSGEALSYDLQEHFHWKLGAELHNLYGPTEAAVDVTYWACEDSRQMGKVPIGRPIANTQIYILDGQLRPVPEGAAGELHIGGRGLARGYIRQAEMTGEKFIPDPFGAKFGGRLYKTGDLARYMADGSIEYLGRLDHQVKIRGNRIELGEIEAALADHASVREAVVVVREDCNGEKRLVGYVVASGEATATVSELREWLADRLPEYMIPQAFVQLDRLPLSENGKLDRKALPEPDEKRPEIDETYLGPRNVIEEIIVGIWEKTLGVDRVGINDNFVELGGHSLQATQLISRLRSALQVEVPLRKFLENPTVTRLVEFVEECHRGGPQHKTEPITRASRDGELPLSFAQQRLWFLDQMDPGNPAYNIPAALRLTGQLNLSALERTLSEIVRRHESLRTTFDVVDGVAVQRIAPAQPIRLPQSDLSSMPEIDREGEAHRLASEFARCPFDLSRGPLMRACVLRLAEDAHVALFSMHHIISDGWSMGVLIKEVATLYEAYAKGGLSPLPELPIQYGDFAVWQRRHLEGEILQSQVAYWKEHLDGELPMLLLPTDRPRPEIQTFRGTKRAAMIGKEVSEELEALSRRESATLFMTLFAAFNALLYRYTGETDVIIGTGIANRNRSETEGLIGFFVNLLPLRTDLSGNPSFLELLDRVRAVSLGAYTHQDLPFDKIVDELQLERGLGQTPLFQVVFVLQNAPKSTLDLPGVRLSRLKMESELSARDLTCSMSNTEQGLVCSMEYNTDLFNDATISEMLERFTALLEHIAARPQLPLLDIPLDLDGSRGSMPPPVNVEDRYGVDQFAF